MTKPYKSMTADERTAYDSDLRKAVRAGRVTWRGRIPIRHRGTAIKVEDVAFKTEHRHHVLVGYRLWDSHLNWAIVPRSELVLDDRPTFRWRDHADTLGECVRDANPFSSIRRRIMQTPWFKQHGGFVWATEKPPRDVDVLWLCHVWPTDAPAPDRVRALAHDNRVFAPLPSDAQAARRLFFTPSEFLSVFLLRGTEFETSPELQKRLGRFRKAYDRHCCIVRTRESRRESSKQE